MAKIRDKLHIVGVPPTGNRDVRQWMSAFARVHKIKPLHKPFITLYKELKMLMEKIVFCNCTRKYP